MVDNEAGHFFNFRKNKKTDKQKTEAVAKAGRRRSYFLAVMSLVLAGILIYRLHWLQIVNGEYAWYCRNGSCRKDGVL